MTKNELERKIRDINGELNTSAEEKTRRINFLNQTYADNQTRLAAEAVNKQQTAETALKDRLRTAYLQNSVATAEDFERDYPQMKSDYLRSEALKNDSRVREGMSEGTRGSF